jgi:hypothetical protein
MTDPLNTPPPPTAPSSSGAPRREQHGCLIIWLVGIALFGIYSAYQWTTLIPELEQIYPVFLVYGALGLMLLEIFAALGVLMRKRWSVYLLIAALLASFILRAVMGILSETSLAVIGFSAVILWGFVRPNWRYYS